MGIRIDGTSDLINAADGSLTVEGLSINVSGVVTASDGFKVGSAATIYSNGNATYAGIVTASNTTISSMGIGIGAATNGSANYPSVTISGNSGGAIHFEDDGDLMADIYGDASGLTLSTRKTTDVIAFQLNSGSVGEKARFDSSGRLLIGTAANQHNSGDLLQLAAESSTASLGLNRFTANAHPSYINFFKSRNASLSGQTVVQDGDNLGQITWAGSDGTNRAYAAFLDAEVDGTPGDGDMPGRITFSTSPDGSESPAERMRIDKSGNVLIGTTSATSELTVRGGGTVAAFEGTGGNSAIMFVDVDNSKNLFLQNANGVFNVQTSANSYSTKLAVSAAGLVGVGTDTSASSCKFQLVEPDSTEVYMQVANQTTGYDANSGLLIGYNGSEVAKIMNQENTAMDIGTNGNSRIAIANDGHIVFSNSIALNGETSTDNRLDDYEEGSWTPVINKAGDSGNVSSYTTQVGRYVKIGKMLWLSFYVYKSSGSFGSASNAWYMSGVPFGLTNSASGAYQFMMCGYNVINSSNVNQSSTTNRWQSNSINGNTTLTLYGSGNTTNWTSGAIEFSGTGCLEVA